MQLLSVILVAAATFGVCYLLDKLFHKLFRNKQEHQSGKAVHLNKKYGVFYKIRVESKVETIKILMITSNKVS